MEFIREEQEIALSQLYETAKNLKDGAARYVQMLAVNKDNSIDMVYSFMDSGRLIDYNVHDIPKNGHVSSISDLFFEAFVCENEISELFGLHFDGLLLDFKGKFYSPATEAPMTVISPEELARREKEAKIKAAMEAKKKKAEEETSKKEKQEGGVG